MKKLGVVFGGMSSEHEVSLTSARNVLDAVDTKRYQIFEIGLTKDGHWVTGEGAWDFLLRAADVDMLPASMRATREALDKRATQRPCQVSKTRLPDAAETIASLDLVFPVLHGAFGEDGAIQGFFRMVGIRVVGCDTLASAVAMDKIMTNQVLDAVGIPQARWIGEVLNRGDARGAAAVAQSLKERIPQHLGGYPVFVKPANAGSSVGVSKVHDESELATAVEEAFRHDCRVVIEEGIRGREIEVGVLGQAGSLIVSDAASEIKPKREFYDYVAKYIDDSTEIEFPAKIPADVLQKIRSLAKQAFIAINGSGMARVDFFYSEESGRVYLNEINTIPGFTSISQYPRLMGSSGFSYSELIQKLLEIAECSSRQ